MSTTDERETTLPIEEIVFSCSICQATPSEVYTTVESNRGLYSDNSDDIVTKLWISSCSHITCAQHLDGGVPFHPRGQPPQVSCPRCVKDHEDNTPRALYSIRGTVKGEYDPNVPDEWFRCTQYKLDTTMPGMEALRFQYGAISHFAGQARNRWKSAETKLAETERAYARERKAKLQVQAEVQELKVRIQTLAKIEAQLGKWEARKPLINHYMGQIGAMADEIKTLRQQLRILGYQVSDETYALGENADRNKRALDTSVSYSRNLGDDHGAYDQPYEHTSSSSARKRKRGLEHDLKAVHDRTMIHESTQRTSSRDLMPPPFSQPNPAPISSRSVLHGILAHTPLANHAESTARQGTMHPTPRLAQRRSQSTRQSFVPTAEQYNYLPPAVSGNPFLRGNHDNSRAPEKEDPATLFRSRATSGLPPRRRNDDMQALSQAPSISPQRKAYNTPFRPPRASTAMPDHAIGHHAQHNPTEHTLYSVQPTPSPRRVAEGPSTSVISPFFNRDSALSRSSTRVFSRDRGHPTSRYEKSSAHGLATEYRMAPAPPRISAETDVAMSLNGLSFIEQPHNPYNHQPLYEGPQIHRTNECQQVWSPPVRALYQQVGNRSTRLGTTLSQRPDFLEATPRQGSHQALPIPYAGRITLPPPISQSTYGGTHRDNALSQIRRVRGVRSNEQSDYHVHNDPRGPQRDLFSSVGSRRSVRR